MAVRLHYMVIVHHFRRLRLMCHSLLSEELWQSSSISVMTSATLFPPWLSDRSQKSNFGDSYCTELILGPWANRNWWHYPHHGQADVEKVLAQATFWLGKICTKKMRNNACSLKTPYISLKWHDNKHDNDEDHLLDGYSRFQVGFHGFLGSMSVFMVFLGFRLIFLGFSLFQVGFLWLSLYPSWAPEARIDTLRIP